MGPSALVRPGVGWTILDEGLYDICLPAIRLSGHLDNEALKVCNNYFHTDEAHFLSLRDE